MRAPICEFHCTSVSYTHLDVYKRQSLYLNVEDKKKKKKMKKNRRRRKKKKKKKIFY